MSFVFVFVKDETYCEPHYDKVRCWYAAKANTTVIAPCPAELRAPGKSM